MCNGAGCADCAHTGLHPAAAAVTWDGLRLPDLLAHSVDEAHERFARADLPATAARLTDEITRRLDALRRVGLGYIALNRPSPTLSRGESQRVRLAVALTSRLEDMLHVLDEPTIGLHPADVARLLPAFRELGGPVVYVEHDRIAAAGADHALDIGPGAGSEGGRVLFAGTPAGLWQADTATGCYFSLRERVSHPERRPAPDAFLTVQGASLRTLRAFDAPIPLGRLTVVTGVSGSGKSTFVEDVLAASLAAGEPVGCAGIGGPWLKAVMVDQSPIGKNPRSNPATYTKLADVVRDVFAAATGLSASHFSFNRPEGQCPDCEGLGAVEVTMRYMPSTWIPCAACGGARFSDEVLSAVAAFGTGAAARDLTIADFYALPIRDAAPLLLESPHLPAKARRAAQPIIRALEDIGLGYLTLGQPSPTLSGGEAQRVKLAKFLGQRSLEGQMLILDEPSTGLHPQDVAGLLTVLDRLVRHGATIVVVEHNSDIIRAADWVLDLGPGAGPHGGNLLYAGPPDGLLETDGSVTGAALREEDELWISGSADQRISESADQRVGGSADQRISESADERMSGSASQRISELTESPPLPLSPSPPPPPSTVTRHPSPHLSIRGARAHNLQSVDVDFPKGAFTVVTGVSGSGKSSLVGDVLEAEARRRFLETLSLYERQGLHEGPEAPVDSVTGLGVTVIVDASGRGAYGRRNTVGAVTEIARHLAVLFAAWGERACPACGAPLARIAATRQVAESQRTGMWQCPQCDFSAPLPAPRHFDAGVYAAVCKTCHGIGAMRQPNPNKLIIAPELPLCGGAMYSPGFFPKGYLCKPMNGGYEAVQALAQHLGFDPTTTPWNQMSKEAQEAFLFGYPEKLRIVHQSRNGSTSEHWGHMPGFFGWIRDWDVGGTYTDEVPCPDCKGARLRPDYASVTLAGHTLHELNEMSLAELYRIANNELRITNGELQIANDELQLTATSFETIRKRLHFLLEVGLGYLHLDRDAAELSAGEAQRIKLAGLLGSGLTSLTILVDEPTRGMHPAEVDALIAALHSLRDEGNTVIVVEHDPGVIRAADYLVDVGPGAGTSGGQIVASGTPAEVLQTDTLTARWLRRMEEAGGRGQEAGSKKQEARSKKQEARSKNPSPPLPLPPSPPPPSTVYRLPSTFLTIRGARAHNLRGEDVRLPLGCLVGVCGVSGSGKSTLLLDTLGRALAPKKQTTSVAYEPIEPGAHDAIEGAPARVILVDQARAGITSPATYLDLIKALHKLYAASEDAQALGLDEKTLGQHCSVCGGSGSLTLDMGFLPDVHTVCEACQGSGYLPEAWDVRLNDLPLPRLFELTLDEVYALFGEVDELARPLQAARDVGLGYLVMRQPGFALSGGEAQRLKIAKELCRKPGDDTLYILDEPTVGQHLEDVARLNGVLRRLVDAGNSVVVIEHHTLTLATCDWLIELGPGGGPDGGRIIAQGPPAEVARGATPTARYLREAMNYEM